MTSLTTDSLKKTTARFSRAAQAELQSFGRAPTAPTARGNSSFTLSFQIR